jgi:dienelactone hydrolase
VGRAIRTSTWPVYFENDYRWSFGTLLVLASTRTGGSDIGEVDQVARRLADCVGDDRRWFIEWVTMGDHVRSLAEDALQEDRKLTAAAHYRRAACYYFAGERFVMPKDDESQMVYQQAVDSFRMAAALNGEPMEFLEVPYEDGSLPAILVPAQNAKSSRPPVVIFYTGFDGNKELNWFSGIPELVRRGMTCVSVDTPGVGEAIRFREFFLRHDYEVAGSAILDYLETREDLDAERAGIMAMSLGGYYAPRTASMEPRFRACVAWGAQWDYHDVWSRRVEAAYDAQLPVPAGHLMWSTDAATPEEALRRIEGFKLDGVVQRMRCPFLVCHGEDDQQIPLEDARRLYEASGSKDKELRIFTNAEGGTQHCNFDNLSIVTPVIFDWLADKLGAATLQP